MEKPKNYLIAIIMILIFSSSYIVSTEVVSKIVNKTVYADEDEDEDEDDEDEDDDEHEDEDDDDEREEEQVEYEIIEVPVEEEVVVEPIRYVTVFDTGYNIDTDKDGLVDAIDPNPTIHEREFFTDTDGDGVANALDSYPNEDDYSMVEFIDINQNGIADELEPTK